MPNVANQPTENRLAVFGSAGFAFRNHHLELTSFHLVRAPRAEHLL